MQFSGRIGRVLAGVVVALAATAVAAYDGIVDKKTFTLASYTTVGGKTIRNVRVGYETYGTLNAAGDNAIFIPHFYSGTSHAAGKYDPKDAAPGYWDVIIGSGKPIDTDKYFVVSADTLVNLNTKDPRVVTTGPASVDPDTGKPYGMKFPVVSYRDSVRVHKALVDSLGVKKLKAVAGASGGSLQAMEWGALYPDFVERIVHVIGPGFDIDPFVLEWVGLWAAPIRLDPKWNGGDYYGREEPLDGVAKALELVTASTRGFAWAEKTFGYKWADPAKNPLDAVDNAYAIEDALAKAGVARAKSVDANSMLYTSKANQLYHLSDDEVKGMKAKILFVPASSDLVFPPELARRAAERYRAQGGTAEVFVIEGDGGHLDGLLAIAKAGEAIRGFLAR
ncbi:MAG TPA: homoserine O-acetyltransferase [Casimicrobiaceae bacterium]|jgi:homoserine O-acetyltransferase|nr:homoserine O-acetyltransferase [Casimicrobiaceae bacterium]